MVKLNLESQMVFFETVFGPTSVVVSLVKDLIAASLHFEISLYAITAKTPAGAQYQVSLTKGTTALMKGNLAPEFAITNKKLIVEWIQKLHGKFVPGTPDWEASASTPAPPPTELDVTLTAFHGNKLFAIKAVQTMTGWSLTTAKAFVESVTSGSKTPPSITIPIDKAMEILSTLTDKKVGAEGTATYDGVTHSLAGIVIPLLEAKKKTATLTEAVKKAGDAAKDLSAALAEGMEHGPALYKQQVAKGAAVVAEALGVKTKTSQVISLRDSQAIGQPVHGTSQGSVYYTVATGPRVRLAARVHKGGSVSIRAEWKPTLTPDEKQKLQDIGLQMKSDYASMHLNAADVPVGRVIGAFVIGIGLEWDAIVKSSAELVVEG